MLDKYGQPIQVKEMAIYGTQQTFLFDMWRRYQLPVEINDMKEKVCGFCVWFCVCVYDHIYIPTPYTHIHADTQPHTPPPPTPPTQMHRSYHG